MPKRSQRRHKLNALDDIGLADGVRPDENGQPADAFQIERLVRSEVSQPNARQVQRHRARPFREPADSTMRAALGNPNGHDQVQVVLRGDRTEDAGLERRLNLEVNLVACNRRKAFEHISVVEGDLDVLAFDLARKRLLRRSDVLRRCGQLNRLRGHVQIELHRRGRRAEQGGALHARNKSIDVDEGTRRVALGDQLLVIREVPPDPSVDEHRVLARHENLIVGKRDGDGRPVFGRDAISERNDPRDDGLELIRRRGGHGRFGDCEAIRVGGDHAQLARLERHQDPGEDGAAGVLRNHARHAFDHTRKLSEGISMR